MKRIVISAGLAAALATLAACGGGGNNNDSAQQSTPVANPFAKYEGNWTTTCQFHHHEVYTLTSSSNGTVLTFNDKSEYFLNDDCSGAIVATGVYSQPIVTLNYLTTEPNASIKLQSGDTVSGSVDKGTSVGSTATVSFTGSGVTVETLGGKPAWHILYNGGSADVLASSVQSAAPAGLLLRTGQLYILTAQANTGTGFDASAPLTRSP